MSRSHRTKFLVGGLALAAMAAVGIYTRQADPEHVDVRNSSSAASPLAWPIGVQPSVALIAEAPVPTPVRAVPQPVLESYTARIEWLVASSNPAERMSGYKVLAKCADAQRSYPELAKTMPAQSTQIFQEMNTLCDGLTAGLMAKRFAVIAELAKAGHPGAAAAHIQEAPDGTLSIVACRDANYAGWCRQASGYLQTAANAGDREAISTAAGLYRGDPNYAEEALLYKVAELEWGKKLFPDEDFSKQMESSISYLAESSLKSLSPDRVQAAVLAGRALGKSVPQGASK